MSNKQLSLVFDSLGPDTSHTVTESYTHNQYKTAECSKCLKVFILTVRCDFDI